MFRRASRLLVALAAVGCLQNHDVFRDVEPRPAPERSPLGGACSRDEDCVVPSVCLNQICSACPSTLRCRPDFTVLARNGCSWCAPSNECVTDSDCGPGMQCFAGAQCPPGCSDPSCCFGNLCSDPSCGPPPNLDCSRVGCADGSNCIGTGTVDGCECQPATHTWECMMHDGQNECDHQQYGMPPGGGWM